MKIGQWCGLLAQSKQEQDREEEIDTKVIQEGEGSTYGAWLVVRNGGEEGVEEALTQYSLSGPCVNFKVLCDL